MIRKLPYSFNIERLYSDVKWLQQNKVDWGMNNQICVNGLHALDHHSTGAGSLDYDWGSGKKVLKTNRLAERDFQSFLTIFDHLYVKEVLDVISKDYSLGRARFMKMSSKKCYSWHRDLTKRIQIPIISNYEECGFIFEDDKVYRVVPDGSAYLLDTTKTHTAFNASSDERIHLVIVVL